MSGVTDPTKISLNTPNLMAPLQSIVQFLRNLALGQAQGGVPTGTILPFGGSTAPAGYLLCDGSSYSITTYTNLFTVIGYGYGGSAGTFDVPNGKAMFLRGTGSQTVSAISYSGPALGATQADEFQNHYHYRDADQAGEIVSEQIAGSDGFTRSNVGNTVKSLNGTGNPLTDGVNGTPRTGTETRPVNIGVNYIIKT